MDGSFYSLGHSLGQATILSRRPTLFDRLRSQDMAMTRLAMHHFACRRDFEPLGDSLVCFATTHDVLKESGVVKGTCSRV